MGVFSLRIIIYIIDLLTRAPLRLAIELPGLCLTSAAALLSSGLFVRRRFILLASQLVVQYSAYNDWCRGYIKQ